MIAIASKPYVGGFNSRSRVGSDARRHRRRDRHHGFQFTLPRGERLARRYDGRSHLRFQFTLPRGERPLSYATETIPRGFNSRSRVGSDAFPLPRPPQKGSFNSRSRVGSDSPDLCPGFVLRVSIHAPAWGATE